MIYSFVSVMVPKLFNFDRKLFRTITPKYAGQIVFICIYCASNVIRVSSCREPELV